MGAAARACAVASPRSSNSDSSDRQLSNPVSERGGSIAAAASAAASAANNAAIESSSSSSAISDESSASSSGYRKHSKGSINSSSGSGSGVASAKDVDVAHLASIKVNTSASKPGYEELPEQLPSINDGMAQTPMGMGGIGDELPRNATVSGSVSNVMNNVLGAGLLTLPWAMMNGTTVGTLLLIVIVLIMSSYTMLITARACDAAQVFSFRDLFARSFGDRWGVVVQITVGLTVTGTCISYAVLIGDFIPHVFDEFPALRGGLLTNRAFVVSMTAIFFLLPLSLLRDLNMLRHTSALGVIAVLYAAVLAVYRIFAKGEIHETVDHYKIDPNFFTTLALVNVAFTAHYNAPKYYREMKERTPDNFMTAIAVAFGLCAVVYVIVSISGYFEFGIHTTGDILDSYGIGRPETAVARIGMSIAIIVTFPLPMYALRSSFDKVVFGDRPYTRMRHYLEVICILPIVVLVGILFPSVEIVLGYKGSTFGSLIVYVYPAMVYLRLCDLPTFKDKLPALGLIVFGIVSGVIGTYTISVNDIDLAWVFGLGSAALVLTIGALFAANRMLERSYKTLGPD